MKKLFTSTILFLLLSLTANAQKVIGNYSLSYFDRSYDIAATQIENEKFTLYIQVSAERESTEAMLAFESNQIEELRQSLLQVKSKYEEWCKVAKENNIKEMSKEMDIKLPSTTICWSSSKWFFSFDNKLTPKFLILDNGKFVVAFMKKAISSSNKYIDETIYWIFSDTKEFDELASKLDINAIETRLNEKENTSELFK